MGHRLHVAKTYKVEYSFSKGFNYKVTEFKNLLDELDVTYTGDEYDNDFEVTVDDWKKVIDILKHPEKVDFDRDGIDIEEVKKCLKMCGETWDDALRLFEQILEEGDSEDGYLHFCFF